TGLACTYTTCIAQQGQTVQLHATGARQYSTGTVAINYMLMEDPGGNYCDPSAANIGGTTGGIPMTWQANASGDIGTHSAPKIGTLKTGVGWTGFMQLCFSDTSYSTWPSELIVI
ncbi:MAG: hypothetical protein LC713_00995, partial [Actinobacteria bacterium]|nr:hypothetical protein [Actinomycetota bacterium]